MKGSRLALLVPVVVCQSVVIGADLPPPIPASFRGADMTAEETRRAFEGCSGLSGYGQPLWPTRHAYATDLERSAHYVVEDIVDGNGVGTLLGPGLVDQMRWWGISAEWDADAGAWAGHCPEDENAGTPFQLRFLADDPVAPGTPGPVIASRIVVPDMVYIGFGYSKYPIMEYTAEFQPVDATSVSWVELRRLVGADAASGNPCEFLWIDELDGATHDRYAIYGGTEATSDFSMCLNLRATQSTVTMSVTGSGTGNVTSIPAGIICGSHGSDCEEPYDPGTQVSLISTPDPGSVSAGFRGPGPTCTNGHGVAVMTTDHQCTCEFARLQDLIFADDFETGDTSAWSSTTGLAVMLWDNGPMITNPGGGAGGADASELQTGLGMDTYGFGAQVSQGYRVADEFTVSNAAGWFINTITFFAYQTGSTTTSTITAVNLQIWDGPPNDPTASVVWGDSTSSIMTSSAWTNIYRARTSYPLETDRPIMGVVGSVNATLPLGTYWLDWQFDGTLSSGPWQPPVSIVGQTTTGNALHYTGFWEPLIDVGQHGLPFVISGWFPDTGS